MLADQGGSCAICARPAAAFPIKLAVDHDHKTGRVRGLLCSPCNTALGGFQDDPAVLLRAAAYVTES